MSPKELTKLAAACRKAGITYYKCPEFEFTLGPIGQPRVVNGALKQTGSTPDPVSEDELTEEALLFWSSQDLPGKVTSES